VDIRSLAPNILWSFLHHFDMNFESRSLMIKLGSPCRWTISLRYIQESSVAVIFVCTGMRCTILVILQMTTHR
jgi:hypothetical protein